MTAALVVGEWSAECLSRTLPPGRTRYSLYRWLGTPQGRARPTEKIDPQAFDPRTVQPIVIPNPIELPDHTTSVYAIKTIQQMLFREIIHDFSYINTKPKKKL